MPLILNIDTAVDAASICLAKDGTVLYISKKEKQNEHSEWLHIGIKEMFQTTGLSINVLDAVAVTIGPGSYTGLRIGLATAKGICYALNKPLITVNTLLMMANAANNEPADLLCPLIDAKRMEVFTAIYSKELKTIMEPKAMVLDENSFSEKLSVNKICFFGNGSKKFKEICTNSNAIFSNIIPDASHMIRLSEKYFTENQFADLAYTEPLYLKEFYTPPKRSSTH